MILYFTGTGNSRYLAEGFSKLLNDDEIIPINELMKTKLYDEFKSDKPFVIVTPVYAYEIPRVLANFIKNSSFLGSNEVYLIVTCGGSPIGTYGRAKKLFSKKNMFIKGFSAINMPENYIAVFQAPDEIVSSQIISNGREELEKVSKWIINKESFYIRSGNFLSSIISSILNWGCYTFIISSKGFKVKENCSSCGKCVNLCPLNGIDLEEGKPKWNGKCTHCMACICACPNESIEYKNHTKGLRRYYLKDSYE